MGLYLMGNSGRFPGVALVPYRNLSDHTTFCEAYSFTTDGYGIFNVRTHLLDACVHTKGAGVGVGVGVGGQSQTSLHKS